MPPPSSPAIKLIPRGASLQEFLLPVSTSSTPVNLVLSYPSADSYANNPAFLGNTIGRFANRITNARFPLSSQTHSLPVNNGPHTLHGGPEGWSTREWAGPNYALTSDGVEAAEFTLHSPDGDSGFPGAVDAKARYAASEIIGANGKKKIQVEIEYEARLVEGEETIINITNHTYFNLNPGSATIGGTVACLGSSKFLPIDSTGVPIKGCSPKKWDALSGRFVIGETEPVVDDCFVFDDIKPNEVPLDTRKGELRVCGRFWHPESRIHLVVESTEPAFQFYTGEYVNIEPREDGTKKMVPRAGFCVEPARWTDAANREDWSDMVKVRKGDCWGSRIVYTAWEGDEHDMVNGV